MRFLETAVQGSYLVELEPREDERGSFARTFCAREFEAQGIDPRVVQCNLSYNRVKGTLRGLHFQEAPVSETKLVRCVRGSLWDVVLDIRPDSPTRGRFEGVELNADNRRALLVPAGCAHGFQTLQDDTEILYQMSEFFSPEHGRGIRYDDPAFGIPWPLPVSAISERDLAWPDVS